MRTYYVTVAPQEGGACVHIESWVRDGEDAQCSKGRLTIRETNALREQINVLAFLLDECTPQADRWKHVETSD